MPTERELLTAARAARDNAQAVYSGYAVGAALETEDGQIVTGCNIESATYGLTMCAERVALFKALSEGRRGFSRIAIVAGGPPFVAPCGACRQMLWEFGGDLGVVCATLEGETKYASLSDLLPDAFDSRHLGR